MKKKILIVGPPGSGKSTLACNIGKLYGYPVIQLDDIYWKQGWIAVEEESFKNTVKKIAAQERWIIDGEYQSVNDFLSDQADIIIYLDVLLPILLKNVIFRAVTGWIKKRKTCGGNRESIRRLFIKDGMVTYTMKQYHNSMFLMNNKYSAKTVIFKGYPQKHKLKEILS